MRHPTLKASSARPAQTPLVGCADHALSLTSNTVALRHRVCDSPGPLRRSAGCGEKAPATFADSHRAAARCGTRAQRAGFERGLSVVRLPERARAKRAKIAQSKLGL
jgi:hypothetical protein